MDFESKIDKLVSIYGADDRLPSEAQWRLVADVPADIPLTISNLIEVEQGNVASADIGFEGSGAEAWSRYAEFAAPVMERYGVKVLSSAELEFPVIGPEHNHWNVAVMAHYPDSRAFLDLHLDEEYCERALPYRRLFIKRHWMFLTQNNGD